jgi:hypothetical protein
VTLILRRLGRGNWSPITLTFDEKRHQTLPAPIEARRGARVQLGEQTYRVSKVIA